MSKVAKFPVANVRDDKGRFIAGRYEYRGVSFKRERTTFTATGLRFKLGRFTFETEAAMLGHIDSLKGKK